MPTVHAEDLLGVLLRLVGGLGDLHAAGLAAPTGLDLGLDDGHTAGLGSDLLGGCLGLRRSRGGLAAQDRDAVRLEHVSRLVLEKIHAESILFSGFKGISASHSSPRL